MSEIPDRTEIPLRMLPGNIDVLLEQMLYVNAIGFRRDPDSAEGILLIVSMDDDQKKTAAEIGFKTAKPLPQDTQ